jgi:hypothetical protein
MAKYKGDVVFVEGVHYAVGDDGHANKDKPLRWEDDGYRDAKPDEGFHNDLIAGTESVLEPGSE